MIMTPFFFLQIISFFFVKKIKVKQVQRFHNLSRKHFCTCFESFFLTGYENANHFLITFFNHLKKKLQSMHFHNLLNFFNQVD